MARFTLILMLSNCPQDLGRSGTTPPHLRRQTIPLRHRRYSPQLGAMCTLLASVYGWMEQERGYAPGMNPEATESSSCSLWTRGRMDG